jgi:hypothetical protein
LPAGKSGTIIRADAFPAAHGRNPSGGGSGRRSPR